MRDNPRPITIPRSILGAVNNVANNVPAAINACSGSFLIKSKNSSGLINFITAQITVAPRIALGNSESSDDRGSRPNTTAPVIAPDQGVLAPAILFKELLPKEPPTGNELEKADAILATPWLMNSLLGFQFDPSCLE